MHCCQKLKGHNTSAALGKAKRIAVDTALIAGSGNIPAGFGCPSEPSAWDLPDL
jgi:hypothetical protein